MRILACILAAAALATTARAGDRPGDTEKELSGSYRTDHFEIRYRPGSRAGASVERTGAMAERDLDRICSLLEVKNDAKYVLFLFDDVPEIWRVTKTSGNAGFSANDASYLPYDDDQTRFHEMVHIVGHAKVGDPKTMFLAEGIANALLEYVHGVHVHAVAKYYRKAGKLLPVAEMLGATDFYAWMSQHAGLNAYDIAGSWFRFLLDAHGIAKVKRWYLGEPAKKVFGADEVALEKAWLAALDKFELRPEVEALLAARDGRGASGVTAETLAAKDGWFAVKPSGSARAWTVRNGEVTGHGDGPRWTVFELEHDLLRDCVVKASVRMDGPGGVQLRLGIGNQAMLLPQGTFVYRDETSHAFSGDVKLPASGRFELAVVRKQGVFEVWVDGKRALSTTAAPGEARIGLGVVGGPVTFESVRVRPLE
jgi:hypothetical protein